MITQRKFLAGLCGTLPLSLFGAEMLDGSRFSFFGLWFCIVIGGVITFALLMSTSEPQ